MEIFTPTDLASLAQLLLQAAQDKNWALAVALLLVGGVWLARKFLAAKIPFLGTKAGGALLVLVGSAAGMVTTALMGGAAFSGALALAALKVGFLAAGGWTTVKHLLTSWPWLKSKLSGIIAGVLGKVGTPNAPEIKADAKSQGEAAAQAFEPKSLIDLAKGK